MPTTLGKRKRAAPKHADDGAANEADLQALLQRHFEARFQPLETAPIRRPTDSDEDEDGDDDDETRSDASESEWDGISDDEGGQSSSNQVEVVDYTAQPTSITSTMSKKELKVYLSSKPPSHPPSTTAQPSTRKPAGDSDTPEDSAAFLANDLALQRLIAESHILSAAGGNASHYLSTAAAASAANTRPFAEGRIRTKTTDMRIQALGAKDSILAQAKMPMSMRKGILKTAEAKEEKRRREARENGIILERQQPRKAKVKKRSGERPVDLPSVGKIRGAELRISAREIRAIEAEGRGADKGMRRRRR